MNSVEGLLGRLVEGIEGNADLRHALDQCVQRLADPGEGLVEIGGDVRQLPLLGARGEAERDPRFKDFFEGLLGRGFGRPLGLDGAGRTPHGRSPPC